MHISVRDAIQAVVQSKIQIVEVSYMVVSIE